MANTSFTDQVTLIVAAWLNDINNVSYNVFGNGTNVPTTAAQALTNLGAAAAPGTLTQYGVLVGGGTNQVAAIAPGAAGTVLTSTGLGSNPSMQALPSSSSSLYVGVSTGTNTITINGGVAPAVSPVSFGITNTNTGAVTINGLALQHPDTSAISSGELAANAVALIAYSTAGGNHWVLLSVSAIPQLIDNAPVLTFGGGSTGLTYTSRQCYSWKIQGGVRFSINMIVNAVGSSTGAAAITCNLSVQSNANWFGSYAVTASNLTPPAAGTITAFQTGATKTFNLYVQPDVGGASQELTNAAFTTGTQIIICGEYQQ